MNRSDKFLASWKRYLSVWKRNWKLRDYPVVVRELKPNPIYDGTPRKQLRYVASIVNWGLAAGGDSKKEAREALERVFATVEAERAKERRPLPRPGTRVPIEFASQEKVSAHPELAEDFIRRVLELDWAWISDGSSLWDFHHNGTNDALIAKIREVYDVDISDIQSARLADILERIANQGKNTPGGNLR